jgi:hypothetical protein
VEYFAARSASGKEVCLIMFASFSAWTSACSTELPIELNLAGVGSAQLISASNLASSDGWTQVADNLAIGKSALAIQSTSCAVMPTRRTPTGQRSIRP